MVPRARHTLRGMTPHTLLTLVNLTVPRKPDRGPMIYPDPLARVAGAVARPGSHGTVRTLFVYGSSGRRVMTPAAGRFCDLESFPQHHLR